MGNLVKFDVKSPEKEHWAIDVRQLKYGSDLKFDFPNKAMAVLDTGSNGITFPVDVYYQL